jgi:predicted TIM-barrel fold metal-dependent hydrolase
VAGVDVHQHLWPPPFVEALSRRREPPFVDGDVLHLREGSYPAGLDAHTLPSRLAALDRAGLDTAVVSLQPTLGLQALAAEEREELERTWEDGALDIAAAAAGRVVPLSPRGPGAGFAGVSVGADALDDLDRLGPTLDALRGSGFLFVHPVAGSKRPDLPEWWAAVVEYTSQMQRAYLGWLALGQERWPDVTVVFAVLAGGGPVQLERLACRDAAAAVGRHPNLLFDTASYGPRALRLAIDSLGAEQLVFGTDVPVVDAGHAAAALAELGGETERLVRETTPARLLALAGSIVETDAS